MSKFAVLLESCTELLKGDEPEWLRIESRRFNYDYQQTHKGSRDERFGWLLRDLERILPDDVPDPGFRSSICSGLRPPEEARYAGREEMVERARWLMTMRSLVRG